MMEDGGGLHDAPHRMTLDPWVALLAALEEFNHFPY
jgi:hypothetical protein